MSAPPPHAALEEEGGERPTPAREDLPRETSGDGVGQPPPDEPATTPQNRKMHALFRELNLTERADRLTVTSHILGYDLTTSAGLTRNEAQRLMDELEGWQIAGEADERINDILNEAALAEAKEEQDE
jgi:hypothetical protein